MVPTPLGNLEDMPPRALRALRESRLILCEDTRRTRALLSHFGVHAPVERYDDHDPRGVEASLEKLRAGQDLALVSDSGTPVLSDPGLNLVSRARREGLPVTSLPGPFAAAAAVAGSGLPGDSFVFLGFLPRSASRRARALREAAALDKTIAVYESPQRIVDLVRTAIDVLGPSTAAAAVRELSKKFEEWTVGSLSEVKAKLEASGKPLGEFVLVLRPGNGRRSEESRAG